MLAAIHSFDNLTDSDLLTLQHDCACVFNAREVDSNGESYSAGHTYFILASNPPKTGLEELAMSVFRHHTKGLSFDPACSGVEWWSQVIESDSEIAFHFDRDYGLEEDEGRHVYPYMATVTYLSTNGAPTLVANVSGTTDSSESIDGFQCNNLIFSFPKVGNHLSFPGNLLHAAITDIIKPNSDDSSNEENSDSSSKNNSSSSENNLFSLQELLQDLPNRRITFLANIWINHVPSQGEELNNGKLRHFLLKTPPTTSFHLVEAPSSQYSAINAENLVERTETSTFTHCGSNFDVIIPLPSMDKLLHQVRSTNCSLLAVNYGDELKVSIALSEEQPLDEDNDEEDEDSEHEDGGENEDDDGEEQDSTSKGADEPQQKRQKRS